MGATRVAIGGLEHRLLPEAWLNGFLFTYATSVLRRGFLLGRMSPVGFWYYFPLAILFKTPLGILAGWLSALVGGVWLLRRRSFDTWWTVACVVVPAAIYFASSMRTHMNIGIRHVMPVYGFACVACGVAGATMIRRWGRPAMVIAVLLLLATAAETALAAPNYIAFFNVAAGGSRGGIRLLGDSNLDWGQDLPMLAEWQQSHPRQALYLSYFGTVDPAFYDIRYQPLPGNYMFGPSSGEVTIHAPAVVAISASHLQDIGAMHMDNRYAAFRDRQPTAVLGGTIYLFEVPDAATADEITRLIKR